MWCLGRLGKEMLQIFLFFIFAFMPLCLYAGDGRYFLNDSVECTEIFVGDNPDCRFVGNAYSTDRSFVLTNNTVFQRGAVWYGERQNIQGGFISDFSFKISEPNSGNMSDGGYPGADGFAFVLQTQSDTAIGTVGGYMGYFRIFNAIAIEFDQYKNDQSGAENWNDSTGNHVAVQYAKNSEITFQHTEQTTLAMVNTDIRPFGDTYWCRIEYDSADAFFKVYLSYNGIDYEPIIDIEDFDINNYISVPDGQCYMGFTAATGGAKEYHEILSWKICQKFDAGVESCDSSYFKYTDFSDSAGLKTNGSAFVENADLFLSEANNYEAGSVWRDRAIPLINGFATEFSFTVSSPQNGRFPDGYETGADGFAFVLQNAAESINAIGEAGSGLGYSGLSDAVAFEFDLFNNDIYQIENQNDPNGNHFALMTVKNGGVLTSYHDDSKEFTPVTNLNVIKSDSTVYYVKIEYIAKKNILSVWLNDNGIFEEPIFYSDNFNLTDYLNLKDGNSAFVGFTASTGDGVEVHLIHDWKFCPGVFSQKITGIIDTVLDGKIRIYTDKDYAELMVKSDLADGKEVAVYGLDGNIKAKCRLIGGLGIINISGLPSGTYFVSISGVATKKIVVTR